MNSYRCRTKQDDPLVLVTRVKKVEQLPSAAPSKTTASCSSRGGRRLSSYPPPHEARRPPRAWLHATSSAVTEPRPLRTGGSGWRPTQAKNRTSVEPRRLPAGDSAWQPTTEGRSHAFLGSPCHCSVPGRKPENSRRQAAGLLLFVSRAFVGHQRESPAHKGRASHNAHWG